MRVNGKTVEFAPITLLEYLRREGFDPAHVVVELGRDIITRECLGAVALGPEDEINILTFLGGG